MSGAKRIYVDAGQWSRLLRESRALAGVRRDLPRLLEQVREQTQRDVARSQAQVQARQAEFEQAVTRLSERTGEVERRTAQRLRHQAARFHQELANQTTLLRTETAEALRDQREALRRMIDEERAERKQRLAEIDGAVAGLRADQDKAAQLTQDYLADAEILAEQARKFPHERYLPGRLRALEDRLNLVRTSVAEDVAAYALSGAQEVCQSLGELVLELEQRDQEWRACRISAEQELVKLQELVAQNATVTLAQDTPDETDHSFEVDHWSCGELAHLGADVSALLAQVRSDDEPLSTEALLRIVMDTAPELDQRLDDVVGQAVAAIHASQLRTNLAELIAEALDEHHHYQVTDFGFLEGDQRKAFLAKTVHHASSSEIVIEVESAEDNEPPTIRLHNWDADGAAESERTARTESIRTSVRAHSGIDLGAAREESPEPDETVHDVRNRTMTKRST